MMTEYLAIDDSGVEERFEASSLEEAIKHLQNWMGGASFDLSADTTWYEATLYAVTTVVEEDGDEQEHREWVHDASMDFAQRQPGCKGVNAHDWQSPHSAVGGLEENPGVFTHGTGAIVRECCSHCGCYRVTDTWAQGATTHCEVTYRNADTASLAWVRKP